MKKLILVLLLLLSVIPAIAEDAAVAPTPTHEYAIALPTTIEVKQGMLISWNDPTAGVNNLSCITLAKTYPVESFGKWNALWDGWSLDAGFAYDANQFNTGALLLGREFGTLGKYLPIEFPLKDKIKITLYPVGIQVNNLFDSPEISGASGVGVIKFDVSF